MTFDAWLFPRPFRMGAYIAPTSMTRTVVLVALLAKTAAVCVAGGSTADVPTAPYLAIGLRKQLLVDDYVIAERENLTRVLGKAHKENGGKPVIVPDRPWEDPWHFAYYLTAIHADGKVRLWYDLWNWGMGYAESDDGFN